MRDQGRLVEWFEDKGYGFIQPNDLSKDRVFLHIKAFARPGPHPIVGCALEYQVFMDHYGRFSAQNVTYLKASQIKKTDTPTQPHAHDVPTAPPLSTVQWLSVIYIIFIATLVVLGIMPGWTLLLLSIINVITYGVYQYDKNAVLNQQKGLPEWILHVLSLLGGWPTAYLAQKNLRHKTQKQPFQQIYFCTIAFHVVILIMLYFIQ